MIEQLTIRGLRLLSEQTIVFPAGLVALTGETGAGKSLLLGAISLALGQPPKEDVIEKDNALIQLVAQLPPPWLEEEGLTEGDEPGQVIFTRQFKKGGRSQCKVNGEILPAKRIQALGARLLDVHSQDARTLLRDEARQRALFDAWCGAPVLTPLNQLPETLTAWQEAKAALEEFLTSQEKLEAELKDKEDLLKEIQQKGLGEEEENELKAEESLLKEQGRVVESFSSALADLEGGDTNALQLLSSAAQHLRFLSTLGEENEALFSALLEIESNTQDLVRKLMDRLSDVQHPAHSLDDLEEKLFSHQRLLRRLACTTAELDSLKERLTERVEHLHSLLENPDQLKVAEKEKWAALEKLLTTLEKAREKARPKFEKEMTRALKDLGFNRVDFQLAFDPFPGNTIKKSSGRTGVGFEVSFNPGQPPKPLGKIASGGEINRLGLALKEVLAAQFDIPCLMFDEVDAGIGGETAQLLAGKLKTMSEAHQVLVITHNHWVAAAADAHLTVRKLPGDKETLIEVSPLNQKQREEELVRMLGTGQSPKAAQTFARELLKSAGS